jgi:hypothetical protein
VAEDLGMLGTALPEVMSLGPARRNRSQVRMGALFVEAEAVGDRGRLTATGDPKLASCTGWVIRSGV